MSSVTMEEWNNIPEVGDHSLKRKREKEKEIFTPVPDSVVEAERMHNSMETYLDPRQQLFGGFDSSDASTSMSAGKQKVPFLIPHQTQVLSRTLDRISDSVTGQTVVDPRGYMTSLNSMKTYGELELGDIEKARQIYRSMVDSNPSNPQGWIAAARIEEQTGGNDGSI